MPPSSDGEGRLYQERFSRLQRGQALSREEMLWLFTYALAHAETRQDRHYELRP